MNISTQRIDNSKNFDFELSLLNRLCSFSNFEIKILGHDDIKATLSKEQETFKLEISARLLEEDDDKIDLSLTIDNIVYETKKLGSKSSSTKTIANKSVNFQTSIELKNFHSNEFKKWSLFKAIFPVSLKEIKTFHTEFETVTHARNGIEYFYDCLRIDLNGKQYDVTQLKNETQGFIFLNAYNNKTMKNFLMFVFLFNKR